MNMRLNGFYLINYLIKEVGKGGFGFVYSATWLDGIRKVDGSDYNYVRAHEPSNTVALKTLTSFKKNNNFLKEFIELIHCLNFKFKSLMTCNLHYNLGLSKKKNENISGGEIYGVMPYVAPEV
ncbi:hypothetical protein C2G38_2032503 [Gigaspora rosea]|uniref:Protein kinase domain-containing protein n=1 Tax=Gigaspora rosea TaxID=44941 RepID=A0A397VQY9_9GLOM|nr:hypothetical protein C2G38_2032503 [Gigaspora rosea]